MPGVTYAAENHNLSAKIFDFDGTSENELLVRFHSGGHASPLSVEGARVADGCVRVDSVSVFGDMYISLLKSDIYSASEIAEKISGFSYIEGASENSYFETESDCSASQWYLDGEYRGLRTASPGINHLEMDVTCEITPVVAVLDTGVDYTNSDLAESMWVNPFSDLPGKYGYDFGDEDDDPMDTDGHGTHCAGIIAAQSDGSGVDGISDARIMAVKIADSKGRIRSANVVRAFEYVYMAKTLGADVVAVNCSFGGGTDNGNMLQEVINMLGCEGVLTFFAAGNDGKDIASDTQLPQEVPFCISSEYIITVGAVSQDEAIAAFSNYSKSYVDVFAPGTDIVSTYVEEGFVPFLKSREDLENEVAYYNDLSGGLDNIIPVGMEYIYTAADIGMLSDYETTAVYESAQGYLNKNGCIKVTAMKSPFILENNYIEKGNYEGVGISAACLLLDVTDLCPDTDADYYFGCVMGEKMEDSTEIEWNNVTVKSTASQNRFFEVAGRTYFALAGISGTKPGEVTEFYMDELALSKPGVNSDHLEKVMVLSGTSMACPVAVGTYSVLAAGNTTLPADTLKKIFLKNCVYVACLRTAPPVQRSRYPELLGQMRQRRSRRRVKALQQSDRGYSCGNKERQLFRKEELFIKGCGDSGIRHKHGVGVYELKHGIRHS